MADESPLIVRVRPPSAHVHARPGRRAACVRFASRVINTLLEEYLCNATA